MNEYFCSICKYVCYKYEADKAFRFCVLYAFYILLEFLFKAFDMNKFLGILYIQDTQFYSHLIICCISFFKVTIYFSSTLPPPLAFPNSVICNEQIDSWWLYARSCWKGFWSDTPIKNLIKLLNINFFFFFWKGFLAPVCI